MKTKPAPNTMPYKNILRVALATIALLLIPFVGGWFNNGVNWTPSDYAIAGTLLFGTGLAYVLATRKMTNSRSKTVVGGVLVTALLILWAELAVGIFD